MLKKPFGLKMANHKVFLLLVLAIGLVICDDKITETKVLNFQAGCPSPLCADSSCRIETPVGHKCPTCICKRDTAYVPEPSVESGESDTAYVVVHIFGISGKDSAFVNVPAFESDEIDTAYVNVHVFGSGEIDTAYVNVPASESSEKDTASVNVPASESSEKDTAYVTLPSVESGESVCNKDWATYLMIRLGCVVAIIVIAMILFFSFRLWGPECRKNRQHKGVTVPYVYL